MEQRRLGFTQREVAVIGQGTWYIEGSDRATAVSALRQGLDLGMTHIDTAQPDTMLIAADGYLYVTANQLHCQARYHRGRDLRRKPYTLFRIRINAQPVLLR